MKEDIVMPRGTVEWDVRTTTGFVRRRIVERSCSGRVGALAVEEVGETFVE